MRYLKRSSKKSGFSLVETLVGIAVFLIISVSAYQGYVSILKGVKVVRVKQAVTNLANEQFEIIRNLPYADVGIVDGLPNGKVPREQVLVRSEIEFNVTTTIRNIDDPFDGTIGGTPNDLSPADNKLVEIEIVCSSECGVDPVTFTTRVAPKSLETTGSNGALFVQVLDASGQPVVDADVHIENNQATTPLIIDETTDNTGFLQIVDAPPGTGAYEISISKSGYSSDQTYEIGESSNPVPDKPHANVLEGQVTQVSFSIDELSDLNIQSKDMTCNPVGSLDFHMYGSKTIGLNVLKYDVNKTTSAGSGLLSLLGLDWDTYEIDVTDSAYDLVGSNPVVPFTLSPGTSQDIDLIVAPKNPNSVLVKVIDGATGLPLSGATVTLEKDLNEIELVTGRGFMTQTDWSGGGGQEDFTNEDMYDYQDGNIDNLTTAGQIELANVAGTYSANGTLTSSIFDTGSVTNFHDLTWIPGSQPAETGVDSLKFQVATSLLNNASTTWNFVGPDGTNGTFFTTSGEPFSEIHNGHQFLRYRAYFSTEDTSYTPSLSDVSFTFSSDCTPSGQVLFTDMDNGEYNLTAEATGYQTYSNESFTIGTEWQDIEVIMTP